MERPDRANRLRDSSSQPGHAQEILTKNPFMNYGFCTLAEDILPSPLSKTLPGGLNSQIPPVKRFLKSSETIDKKNKNSKCELLKT